MNNVVEKNYLFLGFAIPNSEMESVLSRDGFPQVQTHKFNWNVIKGLEYVDKFKFTYISARPVTDYPIFHQKKIKKNKWNVKIDNKIIEIQEIPFINTSILKIITRFFSTLYFGIKNFHEKKNKVGVIVYSVHIPYMLVGLIISKIYKIDYIAIWTDPPSVSTNKDSRLKSILRNIELKISKLLMKKVTKVIALTKYLALDYAPGKPYLIIEGMVDSNDIKTISTNATKSGKSTVKIIYTGSLERKYGIKNIVDGFLSMKNKNVILEIYGRGEYENELVNVAKKNNRVKYKGFVSNREILKIQMEADFLINARSSNEDFVKYSFPSKTLEYMLSGTPLITTMLPGIPDEYEKYVIILDNNRSEVIGQKLDEVMCYGSAERKKIGLNAQKFAQSKDFRKQGGKIMNFLNS